MSEIDRVIEIVKHPSVSIPSKEWVIELQDLSTRAAAQLAQLRAENAQLRAAQRDARRVIERTVHTDGQMPSDFWARCAARAWLDEHPAARMANPPCSCGSGLPDDGDGRCLVCREA